MMPYIISVANQKGGVGKTTTSFTIATKCHFAGMKTIFIDLDANGHATRLLLENDGVEGTSLDFMKGKKVEKCLSETNYRNIKLIKSTQDLTKLEKLGTKKPANLKTLINRIKKCTSLEADVFVIDTPSTVGALQSNALTASDLVIIPTIPDYLSLSGFNNLLRELYKVNHLTGKKNQFYLLFTMVNDQAQAHNRVISWALEKLGGNIFKSKIPYDAHFSDASANGSPIFEKFANSPGASQYNQLFEEITRIKLKQEANA